MVPAMSGARVERGLRARAGGGARRRLATFALLLAVAGSAWLFPAAAAADVADTITAILESNGFAGAQTGVYVWDLDAAQLVYSRNASAELAPASNLKLATTAAALLGWGTRHRFQTELYAPDVPVQGRAIYGDLYLRGRGDPSLSTLAFQRQELDFTTAAFEVFARGLKREGVKKIRGRVLGDATWFDREATVESWTAAEHLECGRLSALTGNESVADGRRADDPTKWAAALLTQALHDAGIQVTGAPGVGRVVPTTRLVKRLYSAALPAVLAHMNKQSDNFVAETLLKGLGKDLYHQGSTSAGTRATRAALESLGVKPGTYVVLDGSGLSYGDRLTARGLVTLLGAVRQREDFDVYYDSLAIAGVDGTLKARMRDGAARGNAHAKSGTLDIAACLSGYVESANRHQVAFSILMNADHIDAARATKAQDAIVDALAGATLPGEVLLSATPDVRQHPQSALEPVHPTGCYLKPGVQP